jgi:hypothetical protein
MNATGSKKVLLYDDVWEYSFATVSDCNCAFAMRR